MTSEFTEELSDPFGPLGEERNRLPGPGYKLFTSKHNLNKIMEGELGYLIEIYSKDGTYIKCCLYIDYVNDQKAKLAKLKSAPAPVPPTQEKPSAIMPSSSVLNLNPTPYPISGVTPVVVTANGHPLIPSSCVMNQSDLQMLGIPMDPITQAVHGLGIGTDISESSGTQFLNGGGIITWHDF